MHQSVLICGRLPSKMSFPHWEILESTDYVLLVEILNCALKRYEQYSRITIYNHIQHYNLHWTIKENNVVGQKTPETKLDHENMGLGKMNKNNHCKRRRRKNQRILKCMTVILKVNKEFDLICTINLNVILM